MYLGSFLIVFFLVLLFFYFIYKRIRLFQLFARLGIPGPTPNILVGNLWDLMGKRLVTEVMSEWESRYGDYYGYFRGTRPALVVRDMEVIKDILVRNSACFINRPRMVMNIPPIPQTVVGLRDQRWKEVRQILSPTFSSAKIRQMLPIMTDCVKTTLDILKEKSLGKTKKEQVMDVHKLFQGLACDVISGCALAMKVNSQRDPNDKFLMSVKGFLENAMGPFVKAALCFPILAKAFEWGLVTFGYSHEMTEMIITNVKAAITIRRGMKSQNGENGKSVKAVDSLQFMLDSMLPNSSTPALTDEEIVGNAWVFILGGFETTSAALTYTCYLLSVYQDVQEKLFDELKSQFGLNEMPSYEHICELNYLDQVICESLRLYPPVVNFVVRGIETDTQIGPYFVPNHVAIQIPVWQIHHDPKLWPEPYEFIPERFNNNAKKAYATAFKFIPFGGPNPRSCLGEKFGLTNVKLILSSLIRNFKVVPASTSQPHKLKLRVPSVTIVPDGGVPLRFIPRNI